VNEMVQVQGKSLPPGALSHDGTWRLETGGAAGDTASRIKGIPLGEYVKGQIYRGVLTGLNEVKIGNDGKMYGKKVPKDKGCDVVRKEGVFVIDGDKPAELIKEDPKSAEIIKPLITGRDIKRWLVHKQERWLIFNRRGIDINQYPAIRRHLSRFKN